jgi:hypothetical protein
MFDLFPLGDIKDWSRDKGSGTDYLSRPSVSIVAACEPAMAPSRTSVIALSAALLGLAGCATVPASPVIPDALRVPSNQTMTYIVEAEGVQIYQCQRGKGPVESYAWVFSAPDAQLTDQAGHLFGHHYGGPTWEALDGSKVSGEVKARDPGPDPDAIPWLQLNVTTATGPGFLAKTVSILRIKTSGGKAPMSGCSADAIDHIVRVPYRAEYRFYAVRP